MTTENGMGMSLHVISHLMNGNWSSLSFTTVLCCAMAHSNTGVIPPYMNKKLYHTMLHASGGIRMYFPSLVSIIIKNVTISEWRNFATTLASRFAA